MTMLADRPKELSVLDCCEALGTSRATHYRFEAVKDVVEAAPDSAQVLKPHFRALSEPERAEVLNILTSERFCDDAPREVYATLLDEDQYHCSISTMYRILGANSAVKERRSLRPLRVATPCLYRTGIACHKAQRGLVLGYHQAQGA